MDATARSLSLVDSYSGPEAILLYINGRNNNNNNNNDFGQVAQTRVHSS